MNPTLAQVEEMSAQSVTGMLDLCGEALQVDPSGALWWPDERLLVVADLHLEKGVSLAARGALIPPYDTAATLTRLAEAVMRLRPARVIALGDSFHDERVSAALPEILRQQLRALMRATEWVWIAGNHDPAPPSDIGGDFAAELAFGRAERWDLLGSPRGSSDAVNARRLPGLRAALAAVPPGQFQAWVTHNFVLQDFTGGGGSSGEGFVLRAGPDGAVQVIARMPT